jgi:hypothetical protein
MKNKILVGIAVLAAITLISGATMLATTNRHGTQEDPFVTLGYLRTIFRPQVMEDVTAAEQRMTDDFSRRITELEGRIQANQGGVAPVSPDPADTFSVVTLSRNQTITASVGTEIMLRIGSATGRGTYPALVNYTSGSSIAADITLIVNNMYLVTIEGNGITATDETVRVLVRGDFTVN